MSVLLVNDDKRLKQPVDLSFTLTSLTGPDRIQAVSSRGHVATFTVGSRTVAISGLQPRVFTEAKRVGPQTKETFPRTRTSGFGTSRFYGSWGTPVGGLSTEFTTDGSSGRILVNTTNASRYISLNDFDVIEYDMRIRFTIDSVPAGANNIFGLTGNYAGTDQHYRYRLTVTPTGVVQLSMDRVVGSTATVVGAALQVGTGFVAGQEWWIRAVRNSAGVISAYAWKNGDTPPAVPQHTYADATPFGAGRIGVRAFASTGATNNPTFIIKELEITSGKWANPPRVSHDTWVRLLPAPFTSFTADVEAWLNAAIWSTEPDVLALAMGYIPYSPDVFNPVYGTGRRVMGEAMYGPDNPDGTRIEGADFNDYIRTSWDYPNLTTPTTDINELAQQNCLDCSGYVRMIFGYWLGLPMSLTDVADVNGVNLPRRAVDIGPTGPGLLVASAVGTTPPPFSALQIGDVVAFDADVADNVPGADPGDIESTDDHVGIYLGRDAGGNYLFISSRKTANGPTFSNLGGNAYLNGTGTWASSFTHIRRI